MVHLKRYEAAARRRDERQRPLPLDNLWLMERNEPLNDLPERTPERPKRDSLEGRVLQLLRTGPMSVRELQQRLFDSTEKPIRTAIDRLRDPLAWPIVNTQGRFLLLIDAA